jgi:tRNA 2-(methylsulfanyl)-N6-isopentenyladenosine37 hydroxylase
VLCLTEPTDARWIERAIGDLDAVLVDHAHCEMKAASNALSLAARSAAFPGVVRALVALAEEELSHFRRVLDELDRRGIALGHPPVDPYAVDLRKAASTTARAERWRAGGAAWLVERLLVGALIEARSCERFRLLADALRVRGDGELAGFYEELFACEARHFRLLVDLAIDVAGDGDSVRARLGEISRSEGEIVRRLDGAAAIHG